MSFQQMVLLAGIIGGILLGSLALAIKNIAFDSPLLATLTAFLPQRGILYLLAGLALGLLAAESAGRLRRWGGYLCAGALGVFAFLLLWEGMFPTAFQPESWLSALLQLSQENSTAQINANLISALLFMMLSGAFLLLNNKRIPWLAESLATFPLFVALLSLTWELYRLVAPQSAGTLQRSLLSGLGLLFLAAGVLAARPNRGWMALVTSRSLGGMFARRLIPVAVFSPILLLLLYLLAMRFNLIQTAVGSVLYLIGNMTIFTAVVLWYAAAVNRLDRQRSQLEIEREQSEKQFRALIEHSHDVIARITEDGTISYISPAVQRLLGISPKALIGTSYSDLVPTPPPLRITGMDKGKTPEAARRMGLQLYQLTHQDGSTRWIEETRVDLLEEPGIESFICTLRDVTERRQYDEILRENEERYRDLVENANDIIYTHDLQGRFTSWNRAGEQLTGYSMEEICRMNIGQIVAPDHLVLARQMTARKVMQGGQTSYEIDAITKDGRRLTLEISSRLAHLPGKPLHVQGMARDVTERKHIENALKDADRKKDEFLALLAHELRNPLAPLRNGLQIMRLAADDGHAVAKARLVMERQLGHMVRLIDDLLDISRISRNKLELQKGSVLLSEVVGHAIETARPAIDAARHELVVSLPTEAVLLQADLMRLGQVFSNLLTNSAKYTKPGGRIWLNSELEGQEVVVSVRDTGIGIPDHALDHIFDMFAQVDRSNERSAGGLGIGLALVKGLVEMHGGSVTATSAGQDQGSTFTVRLPLLQVSAAEELSDTPTDDSTSSRISGLRVLIVDDNEDAAESMAAMFTFMENEVSIAYDGCQAVQLAERTRPNLILMDLGMPNLDGLSAAREIKGTAWGKSITIIACTGWGQADDRARSKDAGCAGHLVKPVSMTALERLLGEINQEKVCVASQESLLISPDAESSRFPFSEEVMPKSD
jgi:PAS domain S-box-containing protein